MEVNNEEKIVQLMTEMRDIMKKHDRGVRPTAIAILFLVLVLIFVTVVY